MARSLNSREDANPVHSLIVDNVGVLGPHDEVFLKSHTYTNMLHEQTQFS